MTGENGLHRGGKGEPLILLHGASMSWRAWRPVLAELEAHHLVLAPTLAGHHGGSPWLDGVPVGPEGMVDDIETRMDAAGVDTAHLAGNSLGGWVALELARRGRARSVVALSPAGAWRHSGDLARLLWKFRIGGRLAVSPLARSVVQRPHWRRVVLRTVLERGDRIPADEVPRLFDDLAGCVILDELLGRAAAHGPLTAVDTLPCPTRIAWSGRDKVIPWRRYGVPLRAALPGAEFVRLPGVGHVPMYDNPALVARAILQVSAGTDGRRTTDGRWATDGRRATG